MCFPQPARYNKYYTGKLDEVRLWHTTRTQNQINDNRFVRLTGCEEDLILYYDFNEGGGTEIYDKARHTYSLFNGGIDWETGNGPIEDCASPTPDGNPLVVGLDGYRYGFNGMEKDDEVKGSGNHIDFGARGYDPRLGRWLSVDPLTNKYPFSSYAFAKNSPLLFVDPDGQDIIIHYEGGSFRFNGQNQLDAPDNEFVQEFFEAYCYNTLNGGGVALQEAANNSEVTIGLKVGDISRHLSADKMVEWAPDIGLLIDNDAVLSPATVLEHEVDHSLAAQKDPAAYLKRKRTRHPKYTNEEEKRVIEGNETITAIANGEVKSNPSRRTHSDNALVKIKNGVTSTDVDFEKSRERYLNLDKDGFEVTKQLDKLNKAEERER